MAALEELPKILVTFSLPIPKNTSFIIFSDKKEAEVEATMPGGHHTMEFFEMCAALITQLAR